MELPGSSENAQMKRSSGESTLIMPGHGEECGSTLPGPSPAPAARAGKGTRNRNEEEVPHEVTATAALVSSSRTSSFDSLPEGRARSSAKAASPSVASSQQSKEKGKKDRSSLRKGKWTVEEEEYTSRIIHYFNSGLLNLPDGATLRSYLAEKLNCDPMRITKKYAGAACLGRRAQHYRDRAQPTIAEIQLARAELDHLERRFRIRVEEGHSSLPIPPHSDLLLALANLNRLATPAPADNSQALLQALLLQMTGQQVQPQAAPAPSPVASLAAQAPWLLPNGNIGKALVPQQSNPMSQHSWAQAQAPSPSPAVSGAPSATLTNWAFAQAAASLAPAISQLAAANLRQQQQQQQQQLQRQLQQRLKQTSSADAIRQLQKSLEEQLQKATSPPTAPAPAPGRASLFAAPIMSSVPTSSPVAPPAPSSMMTKATSKAAPVSSNATPAAARPQKKSAPQGPTLSGSDVPATIISRKRSAPQDRVTSGNGEPAAQPTGRRSEEDKQAGSILLGFLSSLRTSYEEALKEKQKSTGSTRKPQAASEEESKVSVSVPEAVRMLAAAAASNPRNSSGSGGESESSGARPVTDTSGSQNVESSVEDSDWNSDKKTDPSSSEDSDKEPQRSLPSKGPPRKRLKTQRNSEMEENGSSRLANKKSSSKKMTDH